MTDVRGKLNRLSLKSAGASESWYRWFVATCTSSCFILLRSASNQRRLLLGHPAAEQPSQVLLSPSLELDPFAFPPCRCALWWLADRPTQQSDSQRA